MRIVAIGLSLALAALTLWLALNESSWIQMVAPMGFVLWAGKAILLVRHARATQGAPPLSGTIRTGGPECACCWRF